MASNKKLTVWAVVLLSVLCAASATPACYPGAFIPHNPLPGCRSYVVRRACGGAGPRLPTWAMKQRCCRELSDILGMCQGEALRILMDGVVTPQGVFEGRLEDRPGCPREAQRRFAVTLTSLEECGRDLIDMMN